MATTPKSTPKTTASKTVASKTSTAKMAATPAAVMSGDVDDSLEVSPVAKGVEKAPMLRIRDLVVAVTEASGGKRKDVREIVEATLKVMGDALARGDDMNLLGLGRTRIARSMERDGASHLTLKVRRGPHKAKVEKEPLADEEDDG